jgi:hypothetical protein
MSDSLRPTDEAYRNPAGGTRVVSVDLMRGWDEFQISGAGRLQSDNSRHPIAIRSAEASRSFGNALS